MSYSYPNTANFTVPELKAWEAIAEAANLLLALPAIHPADRDETARDIHDLQNRLLARCAWDRERRA